MLLISLLLVLPAVALLGVLTTFRVAGPLRSIEEHLRGVVAGTAEGRCEVRSDDELRELCELLNEALEHARAQGAERSPAEAA